MTEEKSIPLSNINLAAIPLTSRASRRLLRDILSQYSVELEEARHEFDPEISMDDYLLKVKAVYIQGLKDMESIDSLPDDKYVEAMVAFKKAEVLSYHAKEVKEGRTKDNIYAWCLANFHEEYSSIGQQQAEDELIAEGMRARDAIESGPASPAVFVIAFDGTIVEDQTPSIGSDSPYAIAVMKMLKKNGHTVLIWHDRTPVEDDDTAYRDMLTFLKIAEFVPHGTITHLPVNELQVSEIKVEEELPGIVNEDGTKETSIPVGFIIHNASFNASRISITGDPRNTSFYWGDLVQLLLDDAYLMQEDVTYISNSIGAAAG